MDSWNSDSPEYGKIKTSSSFNPRTYKGEAGGGTPHKVFVIFFLDDKSSAPKVFRSCSFIFRTHFETSLVMVSYNGYEV